MSWSAPRRFGGSNGTSRVLPRWDRRCPEARGTRPTADDIPIESLPVTRQRAILEESRGAALGHPPEQLRDLEAEQRDKGLLAGVGQIRVPTLAAGAEHAAVINADDAADPDALAPLQRGEGAAEVGAGGAHVGEQCLRLRAVRNVEPIARSPAGAASDSLAAGAVVVVPLPLPLADAALPGLAVFSGLLLAGVGSWSTSGAESGTSMAGTPASADVAPVYITHDAGSRAGGTAPVKSLLDLLPRISDHSVGKGSGV